jgi:hypothetical protein
MKILAWGLRFDFLPALDTFEPSTMLFSGAEYGDRMQQIFADRSKYLIDRVISIALHARLAPFPKSVKNYSSPINIPYSLTPRRLLESG